MPVQSKPCLNPLDESENGGLVRMAKLVENIFHVPIAYLALVGSDLSVTTRVGSGDEYWGNLKTDYRESVLAKYWIAFRDRKPVTIEFPMRRHHGEYRWIKALGAPIFWDNDHYAGYIVCFIDVISELRPPEFASWMQSQLPAPSLTP